MSGSQNTLPNEELTWLREANEKRPHVFNPYTMIDRLLATIESRDRRFALLELQAAKNETKVPPIADFVADQFPLERVVMNGMMGGSDPL